MFSEKCFENPGCITKIKNVQQIVWISKKVETNFKNQMMCKGEYAEKLAGRPYLKRVL